MENQTVRKKVIRFQTRGAAFAALYGSKVGRIISMNRDGLCFRYLRDASHGEDDSRKKYKVSIFHQDGFTLHDVPCSIVKDRSLLSEYSFNLMTMGKCEIQFNEMTVEQQTDLDYFITHFIGNDAESRTNER